MNKMNSVKQSLEAQKEITIYMDIYYIDIYIFTGVSLPSPNIEKVENHMFQMLPQTKQIFNFHVTI